jgi:hypothetical protein
MLYPLLTQDKLVRDEDEQLIVPKVNSGGTVIVTTVPAGCALIGT